MNFARKQLEKYGWTDGKGLGKNENGIAEAIKPKLKRSVTGIGHDAAADFTEHWWSQLYDKAAKNVEVKEKNGKTKKIKTKDDQFKITNSTYHLNKSDSKPSHEEYSDFFVKTVVLTNGGTQERLTEKELEGEEDREKKDVFKMTDEELFAACEGRTAHKGARHGLKATGKLARIERQEQELLAQSKYTGYSHSKKMKRNKNPPSDIEEVVENSNIDEGGHCKAKKKRKKRLRLLRLCSFSNENLKEAESAVEPLPVEKDVEMAGTDSDVPSENIFKQKGVDGNDQSKNTVKGKKKKKQSELGLEAMETENALSSQELEEIQNVKKNKKKKKRKDNCKS